MTQRERDRLVTIKKTKKKLIRQRQAAEEIGVAETHVRRMFEGLGEARGQGGSSRATGRPSKARITPETRERIVEILPTEVHRDFGRAESAGTA